MRIDLNADLGEGFGRWQLGDDEALLKLVTSANIACGFHAGDPLIMRRVCELAVEGGVAIGAQVGYHDLVGFGRRRIEMERSALAADVLYQLGALSACARAAGGTVDYVKPHGALYNTAVSDHSQASAIVDAIQAFDDGLPVLTLPGSVLAAVAAERGIAVVGEGFADRGYEQDGSLLPRDQPGAVLHDPTEIADRARTMVLAGTVPAVDGTPIPLSIATLCVHGDTPEAVEVARRVRDALIGSGCEVVRFA